MYREDGEAVWTCELNSYGKVRNFQGEFKTECPFRFQGQYHDNETGLYYNRFRYYSPEEGVYISQDPISIEGGFTLYSYVHEPNSWIDFFGLAKRGPKTDPNAPHNAEIRKWGDEVEAKYGKGSVLAGGGRSTEATIDTSGGYKSKRRPDIVWRDDKGNIHYGNVGKTNAKGKPVKREIEAMRDLNASRKKKGLKGRTEFRSYNHPTQNKKTKNCP